MGTFHKALKCKSTKAVNISWVKGHVTREHVDKGVTTEVHLDGNKKADEVADEGTKLIPQEILLSSTANILSS